jgi:hypothetical protein
VHLALFAHLAQVCKSAKVLACTRCTLFFGVQSLHNVSTPLRQTLQSNTYAHAGLTCCVQVVCQLDCSLHLHAGLEGAAAKRCLVVGLLRLGLASDGRLHPALGEPANLRSAQGLRPVHVIHLQLLDGHNHSRDRFSDLGCRVSLHKVL